MTNITFSVDDDIHRKMKEHPEIKWTAILRNSIVEYLKKVEEIDVVPIEEFRKNLGHDILDMIEQLGEEKELEYYQKTKQMEKERQKLQ